MAAGQISSEALVPRDLPQGDRSLVKQNLQDAGLPLSARDRQQPGGGGPPRLPAPGNTARAGRFDALAARQPTVSAFGDSGMDPISRFAEAAALSPNEMVRAIAERLGGLVR